MNSECAMRPMKRSCILFMDSNTKCTPSMQSAIMQSMNNAISNNNYIPLADLPDEDYDEEYLAMALESFLVSGLMTLREITGLVEVNTDI